MKATTSPNQKNKHLRPSQIANNAIAKGVKLNTDPIPPSVFFNQASQSSCKTSSSQNTCRRSKENQLVLIDQNVELASLQNKTVLHKMMKALLLAALAVIATPCLRASEVDTDATLSGHVVRSGEVFRAVVLTHHQVEGGKPFDKLARCRVVTKYTSCERIGDFVYIPYKKPELRAQGELAIGSDCILFTSKLDQSGLIHLISDWSVHPIEENGVRFFFKDYPISQGLHNFEKELRARLDKKTNEAEQGVAAPADTPESVSKENAVQAFREYRTAVKLISAIHTDSVDFSFTGEAKDEIGIPKVPLGDYKRAIKHLERSVSLNPYFPEAYVGLATSYWKFENDLQKTVEYYSKALEIDPDYDDVISARGHVFVFLNRIEDAERDLRRLEALESDHAPPLRERIAELRTDSEPQR